MTLAVSVVDEVRRRIERRGLSQTALARAAGIPPTLVHRAMKGERPLQLDEVEQIARVLEVSVEGLLRAAISRPTRSGEAATRASHSTQV